MTRPKLSDSIKNKNKLNRLLIDNFSLLKEHKKNPTGPRRIGQGRPPILYSELIFRNIKELINISNKINLNSGISHLIEDDFKKVKSGRPSSTIDARVRYLIRRQESRIKRILDGKECGSNSKLGRKNLGSQKKIDNIKRRIESLKNKLTEK